MIIGGECKKMVRIWLWLLIPIFSCGSARALDRASPVSLEIRSDKAVYQNGENVILTLRFINHTDKSLTLCRAIRPTYNLRLRVTAKTPEGSVREIDESPLPYDFLLRKEDYVTIAPLGAFEMSVSMKDFFQLVYGKLFVSGKYLVRAEYSNWFSHYVENGNEVTVDVWKGRLASNAITITFGSEA